MADTLYRKPIAFAALATLVVLAGSIATMAYPMLRADMHPLNQHRRRFRPSGSFQDGRYRT